MRTVLVFKTSVKRKKEIRHLQSALDQLMSTEEKWNFDLDDCDNILRIESNRLLPEQVVSTMKEKGYFCEELN